MHFRRLAVTLILLAANPLPAQSSGADFLLVEPAAVAGAVGGAFCAGDGEPESLRYNPAGIAGGAHIQASTAHASAPGDWSHEWAGLALGSGRWRLGAEVLVSSIAPFDLYDAGGNAVATASAGSQNVLLAAVHDLGPRWLHAGLGLRYFRSQLYTFSSQGWAADVGLSAQDRGWPVRLGLALQNMGSQSAYLADADPLPASLRAGLAGDLPLEKALILRPHLDVLAYADPSRAFETRAGLECAVRGHVMLRAGIIRAGLFQQLSFGGGFRWMNWGFDYAYLPGDELGATHLVELHLASAD